MKKKQIVVPVETLAEGIGLVFTPWPFGKSVTGQIAEVL